MGTITIRLGGSFRRVERTFSAQELGHAAAIAQAIEWLTKQQLTAIHQDHRLQAEGAAPSRGFGLGSGDEPAS